MLRQAPREVLRLVSLRAPRAGLTVDLAPSVPESDVVERMKGNLQLLGTPELMKRVVAPIHRLSGAELNATSLAGLRVALEQVSHLEGLTVDIGGSTPLSIGDVTGDGQFRTDLLRVYDSWLAQRLSAGDITSIAAHTRLLRAAAVTLAWSVSPERVRETPLTAWMNLTLMVTPRSWSRREQSRLDGPTRRAAKPNAPKRGRNARAQDLRAQIAGVTTGLEAMRKVENIVVESRAVWERSPWSPTMTAWDAASCVSW